MVAKGYTTRALVAAYYGKDFTIEQQQICDLRIEEAESLIDEYLGQQWSSGAITDEIHELYGPLIYLLNRPVSSIQSVIARNNYSTTPTTLVVDQHYFIVSLQKGIIQVFGHHTYNYVLVSYTPSQVIPPKVQLATTMLVAHLMGPTLDPNRHGIASYSVGEDLIVRYREPTAWPADVREVLETIRSTVGIA